ncbi:MAG: GHMP kinase [Chloroflexota bacterium]
MAELIATRSAVAFVPMTCGELVQGICDGSPFLVSCPIDRYARVSAEVDATGRTTGPVGRTKAVAAARRTLAQLGHPSLGVRLDVSSDLPVGRGFGTSTADVVGAIVATGRALGRELSPEMIARLAVGVEPSDSTLFPGLAIFDHRQGSHWEMLGSAPELAVVALDFGGSLDTVAHNAALDLGALERRSWLHRRALELLRRGVADADPGAIGEAATISALANQAIAPKPALPAVLAVAARLRAWGVCAAHSGTALGLLLPPDEELAARVVTETRRSVPGLVDAWTTRLVDGGARVPANGSTTATTWSDAAARPTPEEAIDERASLP